jgi:hypothetical protein
MSGMPAKFPHFTIIPHTDAELGAHVLFQGKGEAQAHKVIYTAVRSLASLPHLPKQTLGTCYFYSMMNALLNQPAFTYALLSHLDGRISKNEFARQPGESDADVDARRFGEADMDLSIQYSFHPDERKMEVIGRSVAHNSVLRDWVRDVILTSILRSAITHSTTFNWRDGTLAHDKQIALMLGKWVNGHAQSTLIRNDLIFKPGEFQFGHGGNTFVALQSLLHNCGVDLNYSVRAKTLVARVPGCGTTLCVGRMDSMKNTGNPDWFSPPEDGSSSGQFILSWVVDNKEYAHAMTYVRNRDLFIVFDSNGQTFYPVDAVADYIPSNCQSSKCIYESYYTCITPKWPYRAPPQPAPIKPRWSWYRPDTWIHGATLSTPTRRQHRTRRAQRHDTNEAVVKDGRNRLHAARKAKRT